MSGGKRVAGNTAGQQAAGGVKPGAVIAVVVGVLLAAYVGLCVWVNHSKTIFPNVSVGGIDVSELSEEDAMLAVRGNVMNLDSEVFVTVVHGDWKQTVCAADLVPFESYASNAAMRAMRIPGGDSFLLKGYHYLRHLMGTATEIPLELDYWATPLKTPSMALLTILGT